MCDKRILRQKRNGNLWQQVVIVSHCAKKHNHIDRYALFAQSDADYYTTLPSKGRKGIRIRVSKFINLNDC